MNTATVMLMLTVLFDGTPIQCLLDTGTTRTMLRQSEAARIPTLGQRVLELTAVSPGGGTLAGGGYYIASVRTDHLTWQHAVIGVMPDASLPTGCLLGADLLARQNLILDWTGGIRPVVAP